MMSWRVPMRRTWQSSSLNHRRPRWRPWQTWVRQLTARWWSPSYSRRQCAVWPSPASWTLRSTQSRTPHRPCPKVSCLAPSCYHTNAAVNVVWIYKGLSMPALRGPVCLPCLILPIPRTTLHCDFWFLATVLWNYIYIILIVPKFIQFSFKYVSGVGNDNDCTCLQLAC